MGGRAVRACVRLLRRIKGITKSFAVWCTNGFLRTKSVASTSKERSRRGINNPTAQLQLPCSQKRVSFLSMALQTTSQLFMTLSLSNARANWMERGKPGSSFFEAVWLQKFVCPWSVRCLRTIIDSRTCLNNISAICVRNQPSRNAGRELSHLKQEEAAEFWKFSFSLWSGLSHPLSSGGF